MKRGNEMQGKLAEAERRLRELRAFFETMTGSRA